MAGATLWRVGHMTDTSDTGTIDLGIDGLGRAEAIGSGGFASVYSAHDVAFDRIVAVKVLNHGGPDVRRRFEREQRLLGKLSTHANIVTPYRGGFAEDGRPYLVMELINGGSLAERVATDGPIDWREAIDLLLPVTGALAHAHAHGIVHRDVKPENILLAAGVPRLADFGIASMQGAATTQLALSIQYSPPESFADFTDRRDERSDLYSLAATFYTLVSGRAPFTAAGQDSPAAMMRRVERGPIPQLGAGLAPPVVDQFLTRALAKDPGDRPQSATAFAEQLRQLAAATSVVDRPPAPARPTHRPQPTTDRADIDEAPPAPVRKASGRRAAAIGGGVVAVGFLAGAGLLLTPSSPDSPGDSTGPVPVTSAPPAPSPFPEIHRHGGDIGDIVEVPDGRIASTHGGRIAIWDPVDGLAPIGGFGFHGSQLVLTVLADGRIAFASNDETIRIAAVDGSESLLATETGQPYDIVELADGRIAVSIVNGAVSIWEPDGDASEPSTDIDILAGTWAMAVLPDDRLAAASGVDGSITLLDAAALDGPSTVFSGHDGPVLELAVLPDGRLASAGIDGTARVWDPAAPDEPPIIFSDHTTPIQTIAALPDGRVASAGGDQVIRIWDPDDLQTSAELRGHTDTIVKVATGSGGRLISGSLDETIRIWTVPPPP